MRRSTTAGRVLATIAIIGSVVLSGCGNSDTPSADTTPTPAASANGVEDLSANQILDEVSTAVGDATSVHVSGEGMSGDQQVGIDMQMTSSGDAQGTLTLSGQQVSLIIADGATYFSADEAFWTSQVGPEVAPQLVGKYVEVPANDHSFDNVASYSAFFDSLLKPEGAISKGDQTDVDGVPTIQLLEAKNDGTMYVALEGDPLPLKVETKDQGSVTLSEWNEPVTVSPPSATDIVDPSTIAPATPAPSSPAPVTPVPSS
ncbi:MAG TPA: hypothetical protein VMT88_12165 [Actinomycetes bacterium]|nr:hypothetical protein [Actinomycetes bacterium]